MVGAVEIHGDRIELLDGLLDLAIHDASPQDRPGPALHRHVLATPKGRATGGLDLCLVGRDVSEITEELVSAGLPPIVSAIRGKPLLGTWHAWSDTVYGFPGRSSYVGAPLIRGHANSELLSRLIAEELLADPPELPSDGRMHLLKVIATTEGGEWRRVMELDGSNSIQDKHLGIRADFTSVVVVFAVLDGNPDPLNDDGARNEAHRQLSPRPAWLPDPDECPAKRLPASFANHRWDDLAARGGRLLHAIRGCEAGATVLCYAAAQQLINEERKSPAAQSLFLRACYLGSASACTNAAAHRAQTDCAFETFEASCERGGDPWGCTMLGLALKEGDAKHRDVERARKVLPKACALGDDDPACQAAKEILDR